MWPELVSNSQSGLTHRSNPPPTAQLNAVVSQSNLGTVPEFFPSCFPI